MIAPPVSRHRLLDFTDVVLMLALVGTGIALRLAYFSGYGLGDDPIYRNEIAAVLRGDLPPGPQNVYRFSWWFPTAVSCRLLGLNEAGLILPITISAGLGNVLVYALAKALWDRVGGVIAASLLIVHPIDVAWSTMLAPDIILSCMITAAVLFFLSAIGGHDTWRKRRAWALSAFTLWLAFHAKLSALFVVPVFVLIALLEYKKIDRAALAFIGACTALWSLTVAWSYAFTGDPLAPYHGELAAQGLVGQAAADYHRATVATLWIYPDLLLRQDYYGRFLNSVYPHLLILFALTGRFLRIRTSPAIALWLVFVFLAMEFNFQYVEGTWVAGFRNIRHSHIFVHPLILCLTGYLCGLRVRFPRMTDALFACLLVFSLRESIGVAERTAVAFGDERQAAQLLSTLPRKEVLSDFQFGHWLTSLNPKPPFPYRVAKDTPEDRRTEIAGLASGYVVTGGAREPYYGCVHCIPKADELDAGRWRLLLEVPGPITPWRSEPLRVWEAP